MEDVHSYVHVIVGLSKDWCASGLRVGCLWTLNAPVQSAMQNLSYFCAVSGMAQHMLADMLEDTAFVKRYLKENLRRLGAAYDTLAGLPRLLPLFLCVQTAHLLACTEVYLASTADMVTQPMPSSCSLCTWFPPTIMYSIMCTMGASCLREFCWILCWISCPVGFTQLSTGGCRAMYLHVPMPVCCA